MMPAFVDLADFDEDKRIDVIGRVITEHKKTCAVVVDSDPGKADRYIRKMNQRHPEVTVLGRFDGPVPGSTTIKFGPRGE